MFSPSYNPALLRPHPPNRQALPNPELATLHLTQNRVTGAKNLLLKRPSLIRIVTPPPSTKSNVGHRNRSSFSFSHCPAYPRHRATKGGNSAALRRPRGAPRFFPVQSSQDPSAFRHPSPGRSLHLPTSPFQLQILRHGRQRPLSVSHTARLSSSPGVLHHPSQPKQEGGRRRRPAGRVNEPAYRSQGPRAGGASSPRQRQAPPPPVLLGLGGAFRRYRARLEEKEAGGTEDG